MLSLEFLKNKPAKLLGRDMEKNCSKSFSDAINSSGIEEEIIKQINRLKPLDMEPRKDIPKKQFVSEKGNKCDEEIDLQAFFHKQHFCSAQLCDFCATL